MTEEETDEFFERYIDKLRRMTKEKREKIARKDPSLRTITKNV